MNTPIREYAEKMGVEIVIRNDIDAGENGAELSPEDGERLVISAANEGGYNHTYVDLGDVIAWVKEHRPELLG
jgi:hypothetical protein